MLQQPSDRVLCQKKFPVDLNMQSSESGSLQSDLKQLQAQRAGAPTHSFFLDAYCVNAAVPAAASAPAARVAEMLQPAICLQNAYTFPFEAAYDPFFRDRQHFYHHQHPGLYHHFPNYQQQQNHVRVEPSPEMELCQQQRQQQLQKQGCWFPNWQELFDGFPPKEGMRAPPSSVHQEHAKQDATTFPSPVVASSSASAHQTASSSTSAHQTNGNGDGSQMTDLKPLSSPLAAQNVDSLPQADIAELHDGVPDKTETNCRSEPLSASSSLATAIVLSAPPLQENSSEYAIVPYTDPGSLSKVTERYITESPAWLPRGWVTEVQTRQSGATAGTRDKYYKDLVSGRRFRSRNEVIHYLQTGKGRSKRHQFKQSLPSAAIRGRVDSLIHHPHIPVAQQTFHPCFLAAPQPITYKPGPIMNTQTVSSLPSRPPVVAPHPIIYKPGPFMNTPLRPPVVAFGEEISNQLPTTNANVSSTEGMNHHPEEQRSQIYMSGLKRFVESRPQKLPVFKKAKVLSPNKPEDKQASNLWQWLQKSAGTSEQPQMRPNMVDEQNASDEVKDTDVQYDQRKSQLCRDVEMAQKTIAQQGKELQATIEKLALRVLTGKEDLKLEAYGFQKADDAASNVMQATCRLDGAMASLTEAVQSLVVELDNTMHGTQAPSPNVRMASLSARQSPAAIGIEQRASLPNKSAVQLPLSGCMAYATGCINHATYGTQEFPNRVCRQAVHLPNVLERHFIQQAQFQDAAITNTAKISDIPVISTHYPLAQSFAAVFGYPSGTTQNSEMLCRTKQVSTETDAQMFGQRRIHIHRFPVLEPKLDLSLLSPYLSSRQRAKRIQRMRAKHARGFLVRLGRKLCYEAMSQGYQPKWQERVLKRW